MSVDCARSPAAAKRRVLVTAALCVLLGGLGGVELWRASETDAPPHQVAPGGPRGFAQPAKVTAVSDVTRMSPSPAPIALKLDRPVLHDRNPYRVLGTSQSDSQTTIVLFGRGRVVTLHEPGPLDDEYDLEAVFDEYLVVRHRPSGNGTFLPIVERYPSRGESRDPEDSPRD